ncbi:MAG: isoprenylcysteine carboxylmethyltransferase family protein [Phycicoccus sp.]|nr:isoprenylcysteine carboxylmethyltransferase family protein [Phycicoccus sp.]NMM33244.1 isoprenylcysteine carboxylmethyltransferase family protein [Phycicoccus sp.]
MSAAGGAPTDDPGAAPSRLPSLGRGGGGWVGLQAVFLCAAIPTGVLGSNWPPATSHWLALPGGVAVLAGAGLLVGGGAGLGRQLTPFPRPVADGVLRQDGIYGLVRHPIYGGALLLILGWALLSSSLALLPLALAAVFLDAKRRREEAWLVEQHPDYAQYRLQVPRRFIPWVW